MKRVAIIVLSDEGYKGNRVDECGPLIQEIVSDAGYRVLIKKLLPDEPTQLREVLCTLCDSKKVDLILTSGGTGFSPRDITPEVTLDVIDRQTPGIPEAMRYYSMQYTNRAMLSRAVAGIRHSTLIVNLPGSPKAVRECLEYILPELGHGLAILLGEEGNCARDHEEEFCIDRMVSNLNREFNTDKFEESLMDEMLREIERNIKQDIMKELEYGTNQSD